MAGNQQPADPNLAQCEITKQWVPADEIIEIQGHKVCSAGKEILLQRLKSGDALPGEMERPTATRRFLCNVMDEIILWIPVAVLAYMVGVQVGFGGVPPTASLLMQAVVGLVDVVLSLVYFGTMDGARGQTLGKMAGKIKVVNLDGTPITMSKGYLRALCFAGPYVLAPLPLLIGLQTVSIVTNWIGSVYLLVSIILALADRTRQRALHDRLTGTRVIKVG